MVSVKPRAQGSPGPLRRPSLVRFHRDQGGQSLVVVLALITFIFLMGSALALHASVALRTTAANEAQAGDLHAADLGAELGIWWQRNGLAGNPPATSANGLSVTATVSVAPSAVCDVATPVRLTGFESGAVSEVGAGLFDSVVGLGATASAVAPRSGSYSLVVVDTALAANNVAWNVTGNVVVVRLGIRFAALPAGNVTELATVDAVAGSDLRLGYDAAAQRLTLRFVGQPSVSASAPVVAGTWHLLDVRATLNANPRTAEWQFDSVDQTAAAPSAEAGSTGAAVRLGSMVVGDVYTANYDDVFLSTTSADYPIGNGSTVGLRPDGNGTNVNPGDFRHDDNSALNATTWTRLDEVPMTSALDFVSQRTTNVASYVELTIQDTALTCLSAVSGLIAEDATGGGSSHGKASVFDGPTERVVYDGTMDVGSLAYRSAIVPAGAGGWTTAALNGLRWRFGYSNDANPDPHWQALLLEVATGTIPPGTVTVASTAGGSTVTTTYTDVGAAVPTLLTWSTTR
jgi:hypothetical protein